MKFYKKFITGGSTGATRYPASVVLLATLFFTTIVNTVAGEYVLAEQVDQTVSGKVIDAETDEPLPGVSVVENGTTNGTVTDVNGNYTLSVADGASIIFSFVGYATKKVPVNGRSIIDLQLEADVTQLSEVIVVGYGTQLKRELTGSVASLASEDFNPSLNTNVSQMIEGKLAGVQVVQTSGEPGGGFAINIRGTGSINAGSGPLYVVDGLPINNTTVIGGTGQEIAATRSPRNPISFLNPADIASVEVLKDASASAIYGARGANGVVLITTKSGQSGQLKVDYSGQVGINVVHNKLDLLNAQEYFEGINQ
ncbi:MAG: carboxypeptidase-like regulatory domain-containing protein, partial [Bacteroidota bacterium]